MPTSPVLSADTALLKRPRVHAAPRLRHSPRQTDANRVLFWVLAVFVVLAPLPLGSSRAYFWAVAAVYVGLATLVYMVVLARMGEAFRLPMRGLVPYGLAFTLFCLALLAQLLPLGKLFGPFAIVSNYGLTLASDHISVSPSMTLLMLMRQVSYGLFFFLTLQVVANDGRRMKLMDVLLCAIVVYAAYAMISLRTGDTILGMEKWAYQGYATGPFVNRNSFATFLAMGAVLAATQLTGLLVDNSHQHVDDGWIRGHASGVLLYLLAFVFIGLVILATQSRMGLFAAAAGSAAGAVLMLSRAKGVARLIAWIAGPLLALVILTILYFGDTLLDRLGTVEQASIVRGDFYLQILELIRLRPWTGFGGGSFEHAFPLVHQLPVNSDATWDRGHNTYLTLWSELGIVAGSIPILIILGLTATIALKFWRSTGRSHLVPQVCALGATIAVAIHSTVDFSLEIPANTFMFLAILAAGVAASVLAQGRKRT